MPVFTYRAVDKEGRDREGELTAENPRAARSLLREMRLLPVSVQEGGHAGRSRRSRARALGLEGLAGLSRQLGTLIAAGFPVSRALESIAAASEDRRQRHLLTSIDEQVREGHSISSAMEKSGSFPKTAVEMVRAGESSGTLAEVLLRIAELAEKQIASRRVVRSALIYPSFLTLVGSGVFIFLMVYVVPSVAKVFEESGARLPLITRSLLALSSFLAGWGGAVLLIMAAGLVIFLQRFLRTEPGRRARERFMLRLPMVRDLFVKITISRFSRAFASLLAGGVGILEALEIARHASGSLLFSEMMAGIRIRVAEGESLARALRGVKENAFPVPALVSEMVAVGEESGRLSSMCAEIANNWERESELKVQGFVSLIEPAMILIMGLLVGTVVVAILLPIMQINQLVTQ